MSSSEDKTDIYGNRVIKYGGQKDDQTPTHHIRLSKGRPLPRRVTTPPITFKLAFRGRTPSLAIVRRQDECLRAPSKYEGAEGWLKYRRTASDCRRVDLLRTGSGHMSNSNWGSGDTHLPPLCFLRSDEGGAEHPPIVGFTTWWMPGKRTPASPLPFLYVPLLLTIKGDKTTSDHGG